MAGEKQEAPWPVPKFYFKASIGDRGEIAFQEVSGLDTDYDAIDYRAGSNIESPIISTPGLRKASEVTLKKGMFKKDTALYDYFNDLQKGIIKQETVVIQLLDDAHNPLFTWTLKNAWVRQVTSTDMNSQNSDLALEQLILSHEGLSLEKA